MPPSVPTRPDPDASLINSAEFLDELERFDDRTTSLPDSGLESAEYADAFDALESGLPTDRGAWGHDTLPPQEDESRPEWSDTFAAAAPSRPEPLGRSIPVMAAALVVVACLTAGAATAAFVFHDQVARITGQRPASR